MKLNLRNLVTLAILSLSLSIMISQNSPPAHGATSLPFLGVWSNTYSSSTISDASIVPGTIVTVDINATNAPAFNGYELSLFYDPTVLRALSVDVQTGTMFTNPFVGQDDLVPVGRVTLAVADLATFAGPGTGTLAHIRFNVTSRGVSSLTLAAGTTNPSPWADSWSRLDFLTTAIETGTADGYFSNVPGNGGPTASFTFSPVTLIRGDAVVFDASSSFDQDSNNGVNHGIRLYIWDFGDGASDMTVYPADVHVFAQVTGFTIYGNFSVRLTVMDADQHFTAMKTERVFVGSALPPVRNFAISTNIIPQTIAAGSTATFAIGLQSLGAFSGPVGIAAIVVPSTQNEPTTSSRARVDLRSASATSVILTVHTATNTPVGRYAIIVSASRAQLSHNAIVFLTVN